MKHGDVLVEAAHEDFTPRMFAILYGTEWGLDKDDMHVLIAGPDGGHDYEDCWRNVLQESVLERDRWLVEGPRGIQMFDPLRLNLQEQYDIMGLHKNVVQKYDFHIPVDCRLFAVLHALADEVRGCALEDVEPSDSSDVVQFMRKYGTDMIDELPYWDDFGECEVTGEMGALSLLLMRVK